jgi:molecular chaperone DnaJ
VEFYILLGLEPGASPGEIKRAYRRLARKYHPDINPGDRAAEALFRRIAEAYETLSDPERRRMYDVHGAAGTPGLSSAPPEFQGFDFSVTAEGSQAATFGELFADVFRRPADRSGEAGADLYVTLHLSFDEAMQGGERHVTLTRQDICGGCGGAGLRRTPEGRCRHCHGAGSLRWARGHMVFSKSCAACGGTGRQRHEPCGSCGAEGVVTRAESVHVTVPAGIADGARLRLPEKGHVGRRGGPAGSLYVAVQVAPHPLFSRDGDDLHVEVPLAVHEAALGARIEVPAIGGPVRLRVPPGTQSGQRFRLKGRGAPSPLDGRRGDLVVEVRLVLPRAIDERSKELMREFGRLNAEDVRRELGVSDPRPWR